MDYRYGLRTSAVSAAMILASMAGAQVTTPEAEPNDNKAGAQLIAMDCGDMITGNTTGSSTTVAGPGSADTFLIRTVSDGTLKLYTLTMTRDDAVLPANTLTLRGLNQSGGIPGTTDSTAQTAQTVGVTKVSRWYGTGPNGAQQDIYVRVTGTSSTTTDYRLTLTCEPVTPTAMSGTVSPGNITVKPDAATASALDTDWWAFDSSFNPIVDFGHDDADDTGATRNLSVGTYYVALGNYNTATNLGSPADDTFRSGIVLDFPNVLTNSTTGAQGTMNMTAVGDTTLSALGSRDNSFKVAWFSFEVAPPLVPQGSGLATPSSAQITTSTLLTVSVTPAVSPPSTGITVVGNLSSINGSATQTFYDDGSNGDVSPGDNVFSYLAQLPEPLTPGAASVPFTVADAESRSSNGTINFTLTAPPTGKCCISGSCSILSEYNCGQGGGTYGGNGTDCGAVTYTISETANAFQSIAGSGTMTDDTLNTGTSNCDDCTDTLALPFDFNFYGTAYNTVNVSSNDNLQFPASNSTAFGNVAIPAAGVPNNAIYPFWDDYNTLNTTDVGQGEIYYQTDGVAPNRTFTVEWHNVTQYRLNAPATYPATSENFQVILYEGSNNIEFRYGTVSPVNTSGVNQGLGQDGSGGDCTIGIENSDGTIAYSIPSNGFVPTSRLFTFETSEVCAPACAGNECGPQDFNGDGDSGTDQDIEAFFACLGGNCCPTCFCQGSDFNGDGDFGTDQDIEAFFRVLGGSSC